MSQHAEFCCPDVAFQTYLLHTCVVISAVSGHCWRDARLNTKACRLSVCIRSASCNPNSSKFQHAIKPDNSRCFLTQSKTKSQKLHRRLQQRRDEAEEDVLATEGMEEDEEESEYETDSEDEQFGRPNLKPVFVNKHQRETIAEREALEKEQLEVMKKEKVRPSSSTAWAILPDRNALNVEQPLLRTDNR